MRRSLLTVVLLVGVATGAALWWMRPTRPEPAVDWRAAASVLAGDGTDAARDGRSDRAAFSEPFGVAVDAAGTIFVTDAGNAHRIRAVSPQRVVTTLAGGEPGFVDGIGTSARFDTPSGLAVGPGGGLYVADTANNAIRVVAPDGATTTLAGDGLPGLQNGPAARARFNGPVAVAIDGRGHVFVADTYNDCIREIDADGLVRTVAGDGTPGWLDGVAREARFDTPTGLAFEADGTLLIADTGNGLIRTLNRDGRVGTRATGAIHLAQPVGLAVGEDGTVFVSDEAGRVVALTREGQAHLVAGSSPGYADGFGPGAAFRRPAGLAVLAPGRLVLADAGNRLVRLLSDPVGVELRAPASPRLRPRFDADAFTRVPLLWPVSPFDGPHEIAGTHGERRGAEGAERFHMGVDVRVPQGTPVHVVRPGRVASPVSNGAVDTLNEWVRVGDVAYVHIRAGRPRHGRVRDSARFAATYDDAGALRRLRVKRGAFFDTGEVVGSVNAFNHVHLGVGWPGDDHNPLGLRLLQFVDTIPPTIASGGIALLTAQGQPLTQRQRGRVVVSGRVQVIVDAWDQADGNVPWRRLGLHTLGYEVLHPDGTPAPGFEQPRITLRFDRLGGSADAARLVYAPGSGIPAYGNTRTRFLYVVTTRLVDGVAATDYWDTDALPPGDYTLRIHAADLAGNVAMARRDLPVTVRPRSSVAP